MRVEDRPVVALSVGGPVTSIRGKHCGEVRKLPPLRLVPFEILIGSGFRRNPTILTINTKNEKIRTYLNFQLYKNKLVHLEI